MKTLDIFKLIWAETVILCLGDAGAGIFMAIGLSRLTELFIRRLLPHTPSGGIVAIDAGLALATFGVVLAVGLLSGIYSAWKAARIRPLDSIRSEAN